jgi:CelD/BcsL family acetyltransferase involved in cellulose biosynthesis
MHSMSPLESVPDLQIQRVPLRQAADLQPYRAEWLDLLAQVPSALPFQTPEWCWAWWDTFAVQTRYRHDHLALMLLRHQGRLVGVWPLVRSVFGWGPFALMSQWRPLGADPNLTELRTPLVLPQYEAALARYWLDLVERHPGLHQVVLPSDLLEQELARRPGLVRLGQREVPNYVLQPGADWPTFKTGLKRNIKESLRRCYNSLAREGLTAQLEVVCEPVALREQLPTFYRLHGLRADQSDTIAHPDYFEAAQHRRFIDALLGQAGNGEALGLRLFVLRVAGQVVAMRLAFQTRQELYLYYSGYEPAWGRFSVMTTLVSEVIQWAQMQGLSTVNLSVGRDVSKTRWGPQERLFSDHYLAGAGSINRRLMQALVRRRGLSVGYLTAEQADQQARQSAEPEKA